MSSLLSNPWLWTAILANAIAQTLKVLLILAIARRWEPDKLLETGGMPSSHSAMVTSLSTGIGLTQGLNSPVFACALVFSLIVMYDATGVRHSSGQQARLLNDLVGELKEVVREGFAPKPLRVLLGHTYLEVAAGALLGIAVALFVFTRWPVVPAVLP